MKILLCWAFYKPYQRSFYRRNPQVSALPYAEQVQSLLRGMAIPGLSYPMSEVALGPLALPGDYVVLIVLIGFLIGV